MVIDRLSISVAFKSVGQSGGSVHVVCPTFVCHSAMKVHDKNKSRQLEKQQSKMREKDAWEWSLCA